MQPSYNVILVHPKNTTRQMSVSMSHILWFNILQGIAVIEIGAIFPEAIQEGSDNLGDFYDP